MRRSFGVTPLLMSFAATALLSGCGPAASSRACLPVPTYTPAYQAALADAVDALPAASPIRPAIEDLGSLRAQARAMCSR